MSPISGTAATMNFRLQKENYSCFIFLAPVGVDGFRAVDCLQKLFFPVIFEMGRHRLFSVSPAVNYVAPSYVSMVCSLLVTSGLVMLGRFPVMACGMRQML